MAAPTNTYSDYATGNDYKGASFADGAYTSATKTLVKNAAFAASQVNHWLYLESNDGGSIVAGYYKIATWTDASTVILATDAGAGVDDDAAKCTQHDGTTAKPWRSIQGALDLITRDATNGDQVNVKAGTAVVNQAALTLARYGTPAEGAPLVIRGYTTAAGDGGIGEIDCNGSSMFASTSLTDIVLAELTIHNFGNNNGVHITGDRTGMYKCKIHKGASTPSGKALVYGMRRVVGSWIYSAGASGYGVYSSGGPIHVLCSYIYNCPIGVYVSVASSVASKNVVVDCTTGIEVAADDCSVFENDLYSSTANTGRAITSGTGRSNAIFLNNIIEGYSGAGGDAIETGTGDVFLLGYNAFYNNTNNETLGDVLVDLGGDQALAASPFTDAANGDFSIKAGSLALEAAWPGAWYGPAATTAKADMGAVQAGAGTTNPPGWL